MSGDTGRDHGRAHARAAVEDAMNAKHMTLQNLAHEAQVYVGTVRDFLSGERWPRAGSLWKIEEALSWEQGRIATIVREYETATDDRASTDPLLAELLVEADKLNRDNRMRLVVKAKDLLEEQGGKRAM